MIKPTYLNQFVLSVEICLFKPMSGWGLLTISVAEAALPFPPSVDVTAEVVLFFVPMVVPVTCTLKVQLLFALSDPPVNVSRLPPVITRLPLPHREFVVPLLVVTPAVKVSVKPMPFNRVS